MSTIELQRRDRSAYRELETELTIIRRETVAEGVVELTLADRDGTDLAEWTPGAHIDLILAHGLTRQYSLCGSTALRGQWRIGVLLDPDSRGGSRFGHEQLHQGAAVRVRGPRNAFPLLSAPRYQFIAGGIGITPMLPMIQTAQARGGDRTAVVRAGYDRLPAGPRRERRCDRGGFRLDPASGWAGLCLAPVRLRRCSSPSVRAIWVTFRCSSGATSVIPTPLAPARPVRPTRWT